MVSWSKYAKRACPAKRFGYDADKKMEISTESIDTLKGTEVSNLNTGYRTSFNRRLHRILYSLGFIELD